MAKGALKGLTIKIGGDTTDLVKSLDTAEQQAKRLGNTAERLRKKLVLKWDKESFDTAQKAAQDAVKVTTERVENLQQALADVEKTDTKKTQKQITELKRQLENAEDEAKKAKEELEKINQIRLDNVINKANELGNALMSMGAKMTVGVTTPIALAANEAVNLASDLAESQNVVEVAFGESAGTIDAWSKNLVEDFGLSELSAKQYAGSFMTLSNAMGVANEDGQDMAVTLTELSSDMASFYNAEQDVAANALKGIFTGETESLKQFGVVMTEASLQAYALANGIKTTYQDMTQAEKVMLRYQFVTESLSQAQGDFANTSDSLANRQRMLKAQTETLAIELGSELLPVMEDAVGWVSDLVKKFGTLTDEQAKTVVQILAFAAAAGPLVTTIGAISKGVAAAATAYKGIKAAIDAAKAATIAHDSVTKAFTATLAANTAAQAAATAGLSLLVAGLGVLIAKVVSSTAEIETFGERASNLEAKMRDIAENGFANATRELANLDNAANNVVPRIEELANKTERTNEETQELQALIPLLNDQLGYEAAAFDAATGAVNMNTSAIYANIEALQKRAIAAAAEGEYQDMAQQLYESKKELDGYQQEYDELKKSIEEAEKTGYVGTGLTFDLGVLETTIKEIEEYNKQLDQRMTDIATKYMGIGDEIREIKGTQATEATAVGSDGLTRDQRKTAFEQELADLQFARELGTMTQEQYRKQLFNINNQYNYDDLEAWRKYYLQSSEIVAAGEDKLTNAVKAGGSARTSATKSAAAEQTAIIKQMYEEQVAAAKAAYDQQKAALTAQYNAQIKAIDDELKAKERAIKAEIAAINKQIEARRRAKQEEEYATDINAVKAALQYGQGKFDEFTMRQLQAQLEQLEQERADYRWELEQQDRIAALEEELENARTLAEEMKEQLREMYELHLQMLEEEYNLHLQMLDEIFKTADGEFREISSTFVGAMKDGASASAAILRAAASEARSAAAELLGAQAGHTHSGNVPTGNTYNKTYTMTLNNAGYTDEQAARVFKSMMYE